MGITGVTERMLSAVQIPTRNTIIYILYRHNVTSFYTMFIGTRESTRARIRILYMKQLIASPTAGPAW